MSSELCEAARNGSLNVIEALLASGAPLTAADYDSRTCLHLAASEGNLPIVEYLADRGGLAVLNIRDRWGGTPLRDAVREGHTKAAIALKSRGAELGLSEVEASGELCEAARNGERKVVEALIVAGAPIDAADYDRRTCLHLAASEGNVAIVEFLIKSRANLDAEDRWRSTPLRDAVREGHRKVVALMHQAGATLGSRGEFSLDEMNRELREMLAKSAA